MNARLGTIVCSLAGFGLVFEVVGVAVTSHPFGTVAVIRFDVAFGGLNNEVAVCSNGEASLMRASEFAFGNPGLDQVAGLKTTERFCVE